MTLAEPDFVLDGGTVVIDHGYGLSTLYIHLSKIAVHKGERVTQGQTIGAVGATGRATGANLHWGVYWYEMALDPMLAAGPMPGAVESWRLDPAFAAIAHRQQHGRQQRRRRATGASWAWCCRSRRC